MNVEQKQAFVVTGPTSGIGYFTALELAAHGTVVLVGRSPEKLEKVRAEIEQRGGKALSVIGDFADVKSARNAAEQIVKLKLPIAAVINNAGIQELQPTRTAAGIDSSFATNHLGPFAFTEVLLPALADGTTVVFTCSAVEDPERGPAKMAGFRGARYISAEASARGEWLPGGAKNVGFDAYATSKQANLLTVMKFTRENPRLRFIAVEPGFSPSTNLGRRDVSAGLNFMLKVLTPLMLLIPHSSTPKRAAKVLLKAALNTERVTGVYYDEKGRPMQGSVQARDEKFQDRVIDETRAFLAKMS